MNNDASVDSIVYILEQAFVERKQTMIIEQFFPPGSRLRFRAHGLSTPLARRRMSFSPPLPNLVLTRPIECDTVRLYVLRGSTRLSATVFHASRVAPPSEGH